MTITSEQAQQLIIDPAILAAILAALPSSTYSPTFTGVTNISAVSGSGLATYCRIGNMAFVFGRASVDVSLAVASSFRISLPIASNFANKEEASGFAVGSTVAGQTGAISAVSATDDVIVEFIAVSLSNDSYTYFFSFRII